MELFWNLSKSVLCSVVFIDIPKLHFIEIQLKIPLKYPGCTVKLMKLSSYFCYFQSTKTPQMGRSNFANVLITTRLLPYFNNDNVAAMKSCIFGELKCANEKEFLCKVLTLINASLSNKSTTIIKNKAMEIADSQPLSLLTKAKSASTVLKLIEDRYNDPLSNLNGYIIDLVGLFLTKQESILFGYLNKQLYIETQKLSYLLQRCKDTYQNRLSSHPFVLDLSRASALLWSGSSAYNYNFPLHLSLTNTYCRFGSRIRYPWKQILKKKFFSNFFLRVNYLECHILDLIPHIPISVLFNSRCKFYDSDESREYMPQFSIAGSYPNNDTDYDKRFESSIDSFCQKFEKYKQVNSSKMRKIKCFRFDIERSFEVGGCSDEYTGWRMPYELKRFFLLCCGMSQEIVIHCSLQRLGINTVNELKQMFHSNLKRLCFKKGSLTFKYDSHDNHGNEQDLVHECKLEEIEMTHTVNKHLMEYYGNDY